MSVYTTLLSFQMGGQIMSPPISEEEKKQLFPFLAYIKAVQLNPEYESLGVEEVLKQLSKNQKLAQRIAMEASQATDEDWSTAKTFAMEYTKQQQTTSMKKGGKVSKKKCTCGCSLVLSKEGGKITQKCSCNCGGGKMKK